MRAKKDTGWGLLIGLLMGMIIAALIGPIKVWAAEARKANAEMLRNQISMAWDEEGNFIGFVTGQGG